MANNEWDQQEGEKDEHYELFQKYMGLGVKRTISRLCESVDGYSINQLRAISSKTRWRKRATAWDLHQDAVAPDGMTVHEKIKRSRDLTHRRSEAEDEAYDLAYEVIEIARKMLNWPLAEETEKDGTVIIKPVHWNMGHASQMINMATQLWSIAGGIDSGSGIDRETLDLFLTHLQGIVEKFVPDKIEREALSIELLELSKNIPFG